MHPEDRAEYGCDNNVFASRAFREWLARQQGVHPEQGTARRRRFFSDGRRLHAILEGRCSPAGRYTVSAGFFVVLSIA